MTGPARRNEAAKTRPGPLPLLLLPGLDGTGEMFAPLLPELPAWIRPVVVAYPRDVPLGYAELAPIAARAIPAGGPFAILGESFSGPLALQLAAARPPELVGVILCATFVRRPIRGVPPAARVLVTAGGARLWPLLLRLRSPFVPREYRWLVASALAAVRSVAPAVVAARIRALLAVNAEEDLRRCEVPLLYLQAAADHLIRAHNLDRIRRIRPDVQVARIDTMHFLLQLEPRQAAAAIAGFLAPLVPRGDLTARRGEGASAAG